MAVFGSRQFKSRLPSTLVVLVLLWGLLGFSQAALANPPVPGIEGHLTDAGKRLPEADRHSIDDSLGVLQSDLKVDLAMFILNSPVDSLAEMGESCFDKWRIGKSWEGGGILLIVSQDLKDCAVITTPPPQAPIPPATARQLEELVRGHLRNGDLAAGLRAAVERVRTVRMGDEPLVAVPGNPPVPGIEGHLSGAFRRLPDGDRKSIDDQLSALQSDAQVDMAMFILSRPVESLVDMGKSCFRTWSIGKSWSSGGVLLIVSHDLKDCAVVMTDKEFPLPGKSSKELEEMVRERLRKGELAGGLGAAIGRVRNLLLSGKSQLVAKGNPPVPGIESHLTDAGKRLAEKDRLSIDELLGSIQADAKVDAVVFILATPVKTLAEMGRACFDTWNVGKSWEGGGVLLIVSKDLKDCALVMSGKDSPLKAEAARQLEVNVRERLAQGKPASAIRFAVERMRRQLSLRRRPTVHPRFRPNEEGARRYALGSLLILLLALGSNAVRRWKKWV